MLVRSVRAAWEVLRYGLPLSTGACLPLDDRRRSNLKYDMERQQSTIPHAAEDGAQRKA